MRQVRRWSAIGARGRERLFASAIVAVCLSIMNGWQRLSLWVYCMFTVNEAELSRYGQMKFGNTRISVIVQEVISLYYILIWHSRRPDLTMEFSPSDGSTRFTLMPREYVWHARLLIPGFERKIKRQVTGRFQGRRELNHHDLYDLDWFPWSIYDSVIFCR